MISCLGFPCSGATQEDGALTRTAQCERQEREAQLTGYALMIIALLLSVLTCALFALAFSSAELTMGFGFVPYLVGTFLGSVGGVIFLGSLLYFAIASVRHCQGRAWENVGLRNN